MGNERRSSVIAKLRSALVSTREKIVADGLFVGTSCTIALVSYTHYTPALAHTSPEALSFSDVTCLFGALTSLVLLTFSRRDRPAFAQPAVIWISSACVLASILALALFPALSYLSPLLIALVGGGVFGIYLSVVAVCWLWVYAHHSAATVIWNVVFSALVGSIMLWFIVGMDTPRVACSLVALLGIGAYTLTKRMRLLQGSRLDQSSLSTEGHTPAHIIVGTLLFSYAFMVSLSFAGLEHFSLAFSAIVILIPFLLVSVLMLSFKRLTALSLLNVAVPIVVTATLSASFLDLNPVVTFDLALIGILLFLAYAVVLLCAITEKTDAHAYRAFSTLMLSYFGGCIVGRAVAAWAMSESARVHDVIVLSSVLAVLMAMFLCIRNGFMPKQLIALFDPDRTNEKDGLSDEQAAHLTQVSARCNLGNREHEVLELLLRQKTASEIATEMTIANGTAKSHIRHVYKKLGVHSREELFELFER